MPMNEVMQRVFQAAGFFQPDRGGLEGQSRLAIILLICGVGSIAVFLLQIVLSRTLLKDREYGAWKKGTTRDYNARYIIPFRVLRLLCSLVLLALSTFELAADGGQNGAVLISLICFYIYTTILSFVSVVSSTEFFRVISTRHAASLYVVSFIFYGYQSLKPCATSDPSTAKDEVSEVREWVRFGLLAVVGAFIPLMSPRPFIASAVDDIPSPEATASYLSLLTFSFMDPLIWKAYQVPHLGLDQLPPLQESDSSGSLTARAFPLIDPLLSGSPKTQQHLFWGLFKWLANDYLYMIVFQSLQTLSTFMAPFGLKMLLQYLEVGSGYDSTIKPWVWVLLVALGPIVTSLTEQRRHVIGTRIIVHVTAVMTQLVFEHALRIRLHTPSDKADDKEVPLVTVKEPEPEPEAEQSTAQPSSEVEAEANLSANTTTPVSESPGNTQGETSDGTSATVTPISADDQKSKKSLIGVMTNLATTDLNILTSPCDYLLEGPFALTQAILASIFLYQVLGWSALVGILAMLLTLPIPARISKLLMTSQEKKMKCTDKRVECVTQNISMMRMIKLFAWEAKVENQIADRRESELKWIRTGHILDTTTSVVQELLPLSTMVATYATYTLVMKQELTASVVFTSMAVFELLKQSIQRAFFTVPMLLRAKVSLDRYNDFFSKTELLPVSTSPESNDSALPPLADRDEVKLYPSNHTWSKNEDRSLTMPGPQTEHRFTLQIEKELTFVRGAVNLILGPTASGKTSILMALLGEMYSRSENGALSYNLPRHNGIAYAAQESWVLNDTIRNNIVFGEAFDEERYQTVLQQCALKPDIARFEAGDMSEVGEKGLTLSGGQKARITLARAVYSKAQTLLLDDVLSALDVHTSKWIVDKCFQGELIRGRTVLLVTHNVALAAPISAFAIELNSDGKVIRQGPLDDMLGESSLLQAEERRDRENLESSKEEGTEIDDKPEDKNSTGKLIVAEEIALGRVAWPAVRLYGQYFGGPLFWIFSLAGFVLAFGLSSFSIWFLGFWASQYEGREPNTVPVARYLGLYVAINCCSYLFTGLSSVLFIIGAMKAARMIHGRLLGSIFRAPLRWLDTVPLARIVSRCTTDIGAIDNSLPVWTESFIRVAIRLLVALAGIVLVAGWRAVVVGAIIAVAATGWGSIYLRAQLCVKRENSNAKSPVISHFHAAIEGIVSIRAYGVQTVFKAKSKKAIDQYTRSSRVLYDLNRWIGIRTDALGGIFSGVIGAYLVYGNHNITAGNTGFALNQILAFSFTLLGLVRVYNMFEVQANSAERIRDFLSIEQEPLPNEQGRPPAYWPSSGNLKAEHLSARYSKDGPLVLQDISFDIKSGEKIGIVGRTGAGKSTLALALLRGIPTTGQVLYDGKDIAKLNLDALRSSMTLIPQQPELLAGSLRENLDPFLEHDDAVLNAALQSAGLHALSASRAASITELINQSAPGDARSAMAGELPARSKVTLDTQVEAGGANFSLGQRQILALARALVRKSKILLLDEATASIDYETDTLIQRTIRTELSVDTTVITVAHRLQTIMDSDRVMVLDAGRLMEFASPATLLHREDGIFKSMVNESRDREKLRAMAGL